MSVHEKGHRSRKALAIGVLVLLALLSAANYKIVKEPLRQLIRRELTFEDFTDKIQEGYISDSFALKTDFVNINGLFARLTGRRTLNDVIKLNNGMLERTLRDVDITSLAEAISEFSDYLGEQDIPFFYIQMPVKESLDGQSTPTGITVYGNRNADNLLARLSAEDVEILDLRPFISQTPEMLEQHFYRTDHHWSSDGAFAAFQEIAAYLHEAFPEGNIDVTYAQADQWERHEIDNWFLGSVGKRVGVFFGGTDPLIWHTPRFETEMSCAVPLHGYFYRGDFAQANIRTMYTEEKDYFNDNPYYVYIGGDYPLVQHRNLNAPSPMKVLILQDSFTRPLQTFLSTVFQEIDVVDPRYYSECTMAQYVARTEPDLVILAVNPSQFGHRGYRNLGVEEAASISAEESFFETVVQQDIRVEMSDSDQNCEACLLDAGAVYRVTFEGVDVLAGQTEGAGLRLYDKTTETVLGNVMFDLAYCEAADGFHWTFQTPDTQDEYQLLFYAGIYGAAAGNSVVYRDVTVEKLCGSGS